MLSQRRMRLRRVIDALEARTLFSTHTGTAGPDTVVIRASASGLNQIITVQINGGALQSAGGAFIQIDTLGGSDTVYFPQLERPSSITPYISVNLGDGNDFASNYDPVTGLSSTSKIQFGINVVGGSGTDTLDIDASNGGGIYEQTFIGDRMDFRQAINRTGEFTWSGVETVEVYGSSGPETFTLNSKSPATRLNIIASGGNDLFVMGQRDNSAEPDVDYNFSTGGFTAATTTLSGGAGNDEVVIFDATAAAGTIVEDFFTVTKGSAGFTIPGVEVQRFSPSPGSTVQFNLISSAFTNTYVSGSSLTVNVGNGNLTNLSGAFNFSLAGDGNAINFNDANDTGNDNYDVTTQLVGTLFPLPYGKLEKNPFVSPQTFLWYGAATVTLNTGQGGTSTSVRAVKADTSLSINGGAGPDTIRFNAGNVDGTILAPVFVNGGAGTATDEVSFDDRQDTTAGVVTLNGNTFTDGVAITTGGVEQLILEAGSGPGAAVMVPRVTVQTILATPATTPTTIGNGNLQANLLNNLYVANGGAVTLDDRLDIGDDTYVINGLKFSKGASALFVEMSNVTAAILQANDGDNAIYVMETATNVLRIHANGGNDRIAIADSANFFGLFDIGIDTGTENTAIFPYGDELDVNSDGGAGGDAAASVRLLNDDTVRLLTVRPGGRLVVPTGVVLRGEEVYNYSAIDLAGGSLLLSAATAASVPTWLTNGHNGGGWNGSVVIPGDGAIRSSIAAGSAASDGVGYGLGSELGLATIGSFNIAATDTLVRYTLDGDANLDLAVNFADLVRLAQSYNATGRPWSAGNFDYDAGSRVNFADLVKLAQNYNQSLAPPALSAATTPTRDRQLSSWRRVETA